LVSVQWLLKELRSPNLCIIDATWCLPGSPFSWEDGSSGKQKFEEARIPGARFWDLDEWSEAEAAPLTPHNLPSVTQFAKVASICGLTPQSRVVCYDQFGIFSSPRLWFTLKFFGFTNVAVLNGGLPAWEAAHGPLETDKFKAPEPEQEFDWSNGMTEFSQWRLDQVKTWLRDDGGVQTLLLDARSKSRFHGSVPDPRGLRTGHVPGSLSLPFTDLLQPASELAHPSHGGGPFRGATFYSDKTLLDIITLACQRNPTDLSSTDIALTCGSGLTAATIALALYRIGCSRLAIYDGSWTEYGAQSDTPVATSPDTHSSDST